MQKKLMLLGGIRYLLPVIKAAHDQGYYVITADYLPDNIAHKYSDEYINVSIIDKEAVLKVAQEKQIDGIMSFGVDPGVITAAYVAEKMGLPFQCSYESACILQNKSRFRQFLAENGFNCPKSKGYDCFEDALNDVSHLQFPLIVKPADSAGSKGVTKVNDETELRNAVKNAFDNSISKKIIIEDFLDVVGFQSSTDMFSVDGKIVYPVFSDQLFDSNAENPFVPIVEIWPSTMPLSYQQDLVNQLNRLLELLKCKNGLYNVECRVCSDGKAYLMEVSPRGGGNHIALLQDFALGTSFIDDDIRASLGVSLKMKVPHEIDGVWCVYTIHPPRSQQGLFKSMMFVERVKNNHLKFLDLAVKPNDEIKPFTGANLSLGDAILHFSSREELEKGINNTSNLLEIQID